MLDHARLTVGGFFRYDSLLFINILRFELGQQTCTSQELSAFSLSRIFVHKSLKPLECDRKKNRYCFPTGAKLGIRVKSLWEFTVSTKILRWVNSFRSYVTLINFYQSVLLVV